MRKAAFEDYSTIKVFCFLFLLDTAQPVVISLFSPRSHPGYKTSWEPHQSSRVSLTLLLVRINSAFGPSGPNPRLIGRSSWQNCGSTSLYTLPPPTNRGNQSIAGIKRMKGWTSITCRSGFVIDIRRCGRRSCLRGFTLSITLSTSMRGVCIVSSLVWASFDMWDWG